MKEIDFWFSIGSTYTYLSVNRISEVSKNENQESVVNVDDSEASNT